MEGHAMIEWGGNMSIHIIISLKILLFLADS